MMLKVLVAAVAITCVVTFTAVEARPMHYAVYGKPDLNQTVSYSDDSDVTGENLLAFNQAEAYRFLLYSYSAYLTGAVNPWTCSYCKYTSAVSSFVPYTTFYDSGSLSALKITVCPSHVSDLFRLCCYWVVVRCAVCAVSVICCGCDEWTTCTVL